MDEIENYIDTGLESFQDDPADTEYQKGYEACLNEIKIEILRIKEGN